MAVYDVVVVGAGIEGSATAYNLAKNGQKTLLVEQFPLPHSRGSSHGQSRITRVAYGTDDHYAIMMKEGGNLWRELERESGTPLFLNCGCLAVGKPDHPFINGTISSLSRHGIKHDVLQCGDLMDRYPMLSMPSDHIGVLDHSGGVLWADKALQSFQKMYVQRGGELRDGEEVTDILPGLVITIMTSKSQYKAKNLVLTVGPWATKLLPRLGIHIPLETVLIPVYYWKEKQKGEFSSDHFPTFIHNEDTHVYALPSLEYPGHVKVCHHDGPIADPDSRDKADTQAIMKLMQQYVTRYMPSLETTPSITETCIYTKTPDRQFVLDRHPTHKNIIIGAGFSGHGFKLSPVVGKVLCELVMDKTPSYDLSPCRIGRFPQSKSHL
ncbi:peroxisomal sarcosine oxidase-like [Ostrea edulis]|uniref:peroxisomal sarcosine oxidase-like n=1 Tax=Ostrea edulis TaxID=37623 RepID=UPI0024AFEFE1|nr:peroxisomal sarcosine oxidase-like [Ostrea edulis]